MRLALLAFMLPLSCLPSPHSTGATGDVSATTTGNGTDSAGTTSAAATDPTTTSTTSTTSTTGTTGTTAMCSFLDCGGSTSGVPVFECDLWEQNCPEGQKCMPWSNDGSNGWNSTKCADVMPNAGKPGDDCMYESNGFGGVDSCEKGAMCWNVSQDTGKGYCAPMCKGPPETPTCPSGNLCVIGQDSLPIVCLPGCDPVQQNCTNQYVCVPDAMDEGFQCVFDTSGDMGQQNDPCGAPDACDPGLACLPPSNATECDPMFAGCCLPFCDLNMPECTNQGSSCVAWYEPGMEPPGLKHVGVCRLP